MTTKGRKGACSFCALIAAVSLPTLVFAGPGDFWATSVGIKGGSRHLLKIDKTTGASTSFADYGNDKNAGGLAWSGGSLYTTYVDLNTSESRLGTFNTTTGAINDVGVLSIQGAYELEADDSGMMYAISRIPINAKLYEVDTTTGDLTEIGPTNDFHSLVDLAFDATTGTMWGVDGGSLYTIDTSTGAQTFQTTISGTIVNASAISFDALGTLYVGEYWDPARFFTVNTTTGAATLVGDTGDVNLIAGDFEPQAIPLPSAAWMALVGLGGVFIVRRKNAA